jgi:Glycine zipper 2TM domain
MKSRIILAGIALAALTPSVALAQDDGCRRDGNGRIIGTVVGAGAGGLLGNVIAGRGDKTEGTIIGGIIGAVVGNQVTKSPDRGCNRAYGYYDQQGRWHATGISTNEARGYYDRDGRWVDGAPNGYYDNNGRWVVSNGNSQDNGYVDSNGYWVPASTAGYYDRDNRWVAGTQSGYYDTSGRWVAGPTRGRYDSRGRWISGDPGYPESNGNMGAMEQPGYYDQNGRWRAGQAYGYYDSRGRWVSTGGNGNPNYVSGTGSYDMDQMPTDITTRISWLREYVREGERSGRIRRADANYARAELDATASQERMFNRDGRFTNREERQISKRLDRLTTRLDRNWRQASRY